MSIFNFFVFIKIFFISFFRKKEQLPIRLLTKQDFEIVLNHYLFTYWDLKVDSIESFYLLKIKNNLPILKRRYEDMKKYIEEHKVVGVFVDYL